MHMLAAAQSGALTLVLTNPIWVVKTRLCLQYGSEGKGSEYRGMVHALAQIYKEEGIRGLYKVRTTKEISKTRGYNLINFIISFAGFRSWHAGCFSWCHTIYDI